MYVNINSYKVSGSVAKQSVNVNINTDYMKVIIGLRLTVDGKSETLYDITNDSGRVCVTNDQSLKKLLESMGEAPKPITTYKVVNGIAKENETRYVDFTTITKITPIKINNFKGLLYECSSLLNTVLFNTDEEGYQTILMDGVKNIKQIQSCDLSAIPFEVDFGVNDVTDGFTYSLTFDGPTRQECYTILGDSLNIPQDTVSQVSEPLKCEECKRVGSE